MNYQNTVIYKIVCNDLAIVDCYVGHTTEFTKRKHAHKNGCENPNNTRYSIKIYQTIRDNGGWGNFTMVVIENFPCNDGNEARARERHWYEELSATMNTTTPNRDKPEYMREYYRENKVVMRGKHQQYYYQIKPQLQQVKLHCECGSVICKYEIGRHKKTIKHQNYLAELSV